MGDLFEQYALVECPKCGRSVLAEKLPIHLKMMCPGKRVPRVLNRGGFYKPIPAGAVLIARPSKWGNPFKVGVDGTREEVVEKYRRYIKSSPALLRALPELRGKDLVCYCAPLLCHGDVLLEMANG